MIEFYQARLNTQTTVAAERLAATAVQQDDEMRRIMVVVAMALYVIFKRKHWQQPAQRRTDLA